MTAITITFDSFEYCEALKEVGIPEPHAKAQAIVMQKAFREHDVDVRRISESTARETVNSMRAELRNELATKGDLRETELRLQKEILQSKHEMIKWFVGISVAQVGVIVGILAAFYAIMR